MQRTYVAFALVLVSHAVVATHAAGKDYYLTLGGGPLPTNNQVSLEKNVLFFQRVLAERNPKGIPHDIYFADGDSPNRDIQFVDPTWDVPRANRLLARLAKQDNDLGCQYRNHQVPGVRGATTRDNLNRWFTEVGFKLPAGDRLLIYVTGHGGKGDKNSPNTKLWLWGHEPITVHELAGLLDKLPGEVPVVAVMVQCYSGGFANLIFEQGQSDKPLAKANRCGFFATVHDRIAAGCTSDIDEEDYREYSSAFWAAISGQDRTGDKVTPPDFDHDGAVSFAEAHAHALLSSDTIDISVKSSDALLRRFSKSKGNDPPELVSVDAPYQQLAALASPVELAVIDGLSQQLKLDGADRAAAATKLADSIQKERQQLEEQKKKKADKLDKCRQRIHAAVTLRWPELTNVWDSHAGNLLREEPQQFVSVIECHREYSEWDGAARDVDSLEDQRFNLERKWVKCQRLLRSLENVALAANLPKVANADIQARYQQMLTAENGTLGRTE